MEAVAAVPQDRSEEEPCVQLLLADDHAATRSLVGALARERVETLSILEAADGAEAIQIGLQRRPQIALLDVAMPRLGGIEVALTFRVLQPWMRLALQTAAPLAHRERAREHGLPLFDKLDLERALAWVEAQAQASAEEPPAPLQKLSLQCSTCGYGVVGPTPPERCPMCQRVGPWIHTPWRPFSREPELAW